jgi:hypothetical protein
MSANLARTEKGSIDTRILGNQMSILQQLPEETEMPRQVVATSLDPSQDLEYPHAPISAKAGNSAMPLILWSLGLLLGILMLLVRTPAHAPPFESLTEYVCDPLPLLPNLGNRSQRYPLKFQCRAGEEVIFQRQSPFTGSNVSGLNACRQEGGLTRIWRVASPSDYGAYVFQSTCGDHLIAAYQNRVTTYESTQRFVIAVACIIILASAIGLIATSPKHLRRRQHRSKLSPGDNQSPRS